MSSVSAPQGQSKQRTFPLAVLLVEVSGQSPEFEKVVLFEALGETEGVEGVLRVGRVPQSLVVLVFDEELVVALVHSRDVVLQGRGGLV